MTPQPRLAALLALTLVSTTVPLALTTPTSQGLDFVRMEMEDPLFSDHPAYDEAGNLYDAGGSGGGSSSSFEIYEVEEPAFDNAFPEMDLLAVFDVTWWPWRMHYMAWDADAEEGYDTTVNYTELLQDTDSTILTDADAEDYARAYMVTVNAELLMNRTIVESEDEDWLGYPTHDVSVTLQADGTWLVEGSLWSPSGGQIANATVELASSSLEDSNWTVDATEIGPYEAAHELPNFASGDHVDNDGEGEDYTRTATDADGEPRLFWDELRGLDVATQETATTFDGTQIKVQAPATTVAPEGMAKSLAEAGVFAYDMMVHRNHDGTGDCGNEANPGSDMGFHLNTTGCTVPITIVPNPQGSKAFAGFGANDSACAGTMYIDSGYYENFSEKYYEQQTPDDYNATKLSRSVLSHEFLHVLQCHTLWDHAEEPEMPVLRPSWDTVYEGQAVFAETLATPDLEQDPEGFYYSKVNMEDDGPVRSPWDRMCDQQRSYGSYWKLASTHNTDDTHPHAAGQFLRVMLENSGEMGIVTPANYEGELSDCDEKLPGFLNATLEDPRTANTHANHSQVLGTLTLDLLEDETNNWTYENNGTTYNWSRHLKDVWTEEITDEGNYTNGDIDAPVSSSIGAWGMHYFRIDDDDPDLSDETVTIECKLADEADDTLAHWTLRVANFAQDPDTDNLTLEETANCESQAIEVNLGSVDETYVTATRTNATEAAYKVDIRK